MIEKQRQFLYSVLYLIDLAVVLFAWFVAYPLRFQSGLFALRIQHVPSFYTFGLMGILVLVLWAGLLRFSRLYVEKTIPSLSREILLVLRTHSLAFVVFVVVVFFVGSYRPSRMVFGLFYLISSAGILVSHVIFRRVLIDRRRRGVGLRRVLVIGTGELGRELAARIRRHRELGLVLVGFLSDTPEMAGQELEDLPVLGVSEDVQKIIHEQQIDQVYVALPLQAADRLEKVVCNISDEMVDVKIVPDLVQYVALQGGVEEFEGLPLISLKDTPLYGWTAIGKRIFDIAFCIAILPVLLPVMGIIALLVKLTSPGPIFYKQERMGLDGRIFNISKYRSMRVDAEEQTGAVWAVKDDPRRTRFGTFIRQTSLDELPQFFSVLNGTMSLVGPRPERPVFIEKFRKEIPKYMLRHKVKAGITGWAQVNGWRGDTDLKKRIEFDLYYIENWSFWLDIRIIWLTIWKGMITKNAY